MVDPTARDVDVITATADREIWHPTPGPGKELDDDDDDDVDSTVQGNRGRPQNGDDEIREIVGLKMKQEFSRAQCRLGLAIY